MSRRTAALISLTDSGSDSDSEGLLDFLEGASKGPAKKKATGGLIARVAKGIPKDNSAGRSAAFIAAVKSPEAAAAPEPRSAKKNSSGRRTRSSTGADDKSKVKGKRKRASSIAIDSSDSDDDTALPMLQSDTARRLRALRSTLESAKAKKIEDPLPEEEDPDYDADTDVDVNFDLPDEPAMLSAGGGAINSSGTGGARRTPAPAPAPAAPAPSAPAAPAPPSSTRAPPRAAVASPVAKTSGPSAVIFFRSHNPDVKSKRYKIKMGAPFAAVINIYRGTHALLEDDAVKFMFDGDALSPDETPEDVDFDVDEEHQVDVKFP